MAQELNGTLFYTEHRFYGKSRPTNNTEVENLRFLSIDQALEDLAYFITHIKSTSRDFDESGVILVGGSYSGMLCFQIISCSVIRNLICVHKSLERTIKSSKYFLLSATMVAWMRKKYPHLVTGAWASSAPLHAQVDFFEYKDVMTDAIKRVSGDECAATFENAFRIMEELVAAKDVRRLLIALSMCLPMDLTYDVAHFFYELSDMVAGLVQSHRSGKIEAACDFMQNIKNTNLDADDLDAFAGWVKKGSYMCLNTSYKSMLRKFRETDWGSEANHHMRQWVYQTCSEFAWFQTSTSDNQIFGSSYPIEYFVGLCQDIYGIRWVS